MADRADPPSTTGLQQWTEAISRAQQLMMQAGLSALDHAAKPAGEQSGQPADGMADLWREGLEMWQRMVLPASTPAPDDRKDKRFAAPAWRDIPYFDWLRRSYLALGDRMLASVDAMEGLEPRQREQLRFLTQSVVDAISPSNFPFTNPEVIERALETRGASLMQGVQNLLADLGKGQLTHTAPSAFEVGRNLATTPGKVIKRTRLYELIQYAPTTDTVLATPLVIFPPWINRFYILDLTPEKSFIRWCVEQGVTVFMVSWKSADADLGDVVWDDYVAAQIEAVDSIRELLDVPSVHAMGYCVAGTTLAATLALLTARGEADKVASATFLTAQVDFSRAGDLTHFVGDEQLKLIGSLTPEGFLDGRYMAAVFNLLRGRDLIWNYVTNNYLLGKEYVPFDLLHWNGDTTNLPAKWHLSYLTDLYRDNLLVQPGALSVCGTPLDLTQVAIPTYVQAGREDHIAPAESVWAITRLFTGPVRFVLAGSGHIAGVVNPPAAGKYQHWINESQTETLDEFLAGATETKGSWWPDWIGWLRARAPGEQPADGARLPGQGHLPALGDAPGEYVRAR